MAKLYNLARMTVSGTPGAGTITLGSAVSGYLTFALAGIANGDIVSYGIKDGANSEIGTGTYTSSGTTLTRTVTKSTNANAAISATSAAEVFITARAEDINPDAQRRNLLLSTAYQSKSFAEYRRMVLLFATGFKGASDTLNGILTASSSNYTVTAGVAGATTGNVAPTTSAGPVTNSGADPPAAAASTGWQAQTWFNETTALANSATYASVGLYADVASTVTMKIAKRNSSSNVDVVVSQAFSHPGGGWSDLTLSSPYVVPGTGTYYVGAYFTNNPSIKYNASQTRLTAATDITGASQTVTETAATAILSFRATQVLPNNMTVVTALQTADSSVSTGRALIEFDNTATPTLNTDLTVEVTCNGGTNWSTATLTSVTASSQGGRTVAETAETACTAGTSFATRIKTLNNKSVPIYAVALAVS